MTEDVRSRVILGRIITDTRRKKPNGNLDVFFNVVTSLIVFQLTIEACFSFSFSFLSLHERAVVLNLKVVFSILWYENLLF